MMYHSGLSMSSFFFFLFFFVYCMSCHFGFEQLSRLGAHSQGGQDCRLSELCLHEAKRKENQFID